MKHRSFFSKGRAIFRFFDLYGHKVDLFFDKKSKFYSSCSGILSLVIIFLIFYIFNGIVLSWINKEKMNLIPSAVNLSVIELLAKNQSYEYTFDYENYYFYIVIRGYLNNGRALTNLQLRRHLTFNFSYVNQNHETVLLDYENCKTQHNDIFLGLDQQTIYNDINKTNPNRICLKDPVKMGLFADIKLQTVWQTEIIFTVYQCENSTQNNNSCASLEEINQVIKTTKVQVSVPNTIFDFQNVKKPQKNVYDLKVTNLDQDLVKNYKNMLIPTFLYTDHGILEDDYVLEQTNFNPNYFYDPKIRQKNDPLFIFDSFLNFNFQIYYRRNQKINEIIAYLGGIINVIFIAGKVFGSVYNSISFIGRQYK